MAGVPEPHVATNYAPLPVAVAEADGTWITDVDGGRYLDCLGAYSAVNFGHRNPQLTEAAMAAGAPRCAGQGHPRFHHPAGPADRGHRGRARLGCGTAGGALRD